MTGPGYIDPKSLARKFPAAGEHFPLVVVGAGDTGLDAALSAAKAGEQVLLVDENPIPGDLMRIDVPYFFGQRFTTAVDRPERLMEQMFIASPRLAEAFEAGIDVRLGVSVWGAFREDRAGGVMTQPFLGLLEGDEIKMVAFDRLVVATGARDLTLLFPGADLPGVMGATALEFLLVKYHAFNGRKVVFLGSGPYAVALAERALNAGVEVAGLVEVQQNARAASWDVEALTARGVPIFSGHCIAEAQGGVEGVERAILQDLASGERIEVECDTICIAIDRIPNVELLPLLGCRMIFDESRGGYVPDTDASGTTCEPAISALGNCAGVDDADFPYRFDWARAIMNITGPLSPVCLCEEVSRGDLLEVRPPTYLNWQSWPEHKELGALVEIRSLHPDLFKRLTRVSMGLCQGRRCRDTVALTLSIATSTPLKDLPASTYRIPIRPLPLSVLAAEPQAITDNWVAWFGIPGQWNTPAEIEAGIDPTAQGQELSI